MAAGRVNVDGFAVVTVCGSIVVRSELPTTQMQPDAARKFAICLLEAAQDAQRPEPPEWP